MQKTVSSDDVTIAYQVQGEGKPALVFVHGWGINRTYWNAQLTYFAKKHHVVTIDLAGHGESGQDRK
jgi:pimeloyl-ACP methyl ester carboxylesterase